MQARDYGQVEFYVRIIVRRKGWYGILEGSKIGVNLKRPNPKTSLGGKEAKVKATFLGKWQDLTGRRWVAWSGVWKVTTLAGRWEMWVAGQKDVFKDFKIDKRAQILITSYTWIKANRNVPGAFPCNALTYSVYNHVGLSLPYALNDQYSFTIPEADEGSLLFYIKVLEAGWGHVGIKNGQDIIDINCAREHVDQNNLAYVDKR